MTRVAYRKNSRRFESDEHIRKKTWFGDVPKHLWWWFFAPFGAPGKGVKLANRRLDRHRAKNELRKGEEPKQHRKHGSDRW